MYPNSDKILKPYNKSTYSSFLLVKAHNGDVKIVLW